MRDERIIKLENGCYAVDEQFVNTSKWNEFKRANLLGDDGNVMDGYIKSTIAKIIEEGHYDEKPRPKYIDGTPAHTISVNHMVYRFDISAGEFPFTTLRPVAFKQALNEMFWIYQDQSNDLNLLRTKYNNKWWDSWESKDLPGTIGKRYGYIIKKYDLVNKLINGIKEDPYGRRHIMSMWQETDFAESDGLKPCAFETLWNVRGEYLDMALIQRSSDYLVAGSTSNPIQYTALLMMVAQATGYKAGVFTHFQNNVQIYDRHLEAALELMRRKPSTAKPRLLLNTTETDFYKIKPSDFVLEDYYTDNDKIIFELGI